MSWWLFSVNCPAARLEQVEEILQEQGAQSLSIADAGDVPIYEPLPGTAPVWPESIVTATFDSKRDPEQLRLQLGQALPATLAKSLRQGELDDEDWINAYRAHFKPVEFAPGLWVVPDWCETPQAAVHAIRLDPGLAFGTGSHPTTALCLAWLGAADLGGKRVIDFGCGSGILAIAACKLGAARVDAIDIDAQARRATRDNCARNAIDAGHVGVGEAADLGDQPVDLLIANILAGPLVELAPRFGSLVASGGRILLSGILKTQLGDIQSAYRADFRLDPPRTGGEWLAISGSKN